MGKKGEGKREERARERKSRGKREEKGKWDRLDFYYFLFF